MDFIGYIHNIHDAYILGEAAIRGHLNIIKDRPSKVMREHIYPGKIVIFEERVNGLKRWTDGRNWTASKLKEGFFLYQEIKRKNESGNHNYSNHRNKQSWLCKKGITIITPYGIKLHIINYFLENKANTMITPSTYPFVNCNELHEAIKKYSYQNCFKNIKHMNYHINSIDFIIDSTNIIDSRQNLYCTSSWSPSTALPPFSSLFGSRSTSLHSDLKRNRAQYDQSQISMLHINFN